jgi:diguanylate cyclase (GGDEF)-like protein
MKILIVVNEENLIERVVWTEKNLGIKEGMDILDIFPEESKKEVLRNLQSTIISQDASTVTTQIELENKLYSVTVFILGSNEKASLLILDNEAISLNDCKSFIKINNEYANIMRQELKKIINEKSSRRNEDINEIHKLNNELINTRRLLQKANMKLNDKNKILEGRLVKDALTGLISRYQYWTEIEKLIEKDKNKKGVFVFIDLDGFKNINDTYGHSTGDIFLKKFAERLKNVGIDNSLKIRIAGDEFALYIHGYDKVDTKTTDNIWNKIKSTITKYPISINGVEIPVSISCGMAVYGVDTEDINKLIEYGDYAMYQAKNRGKGTYNIFNLEKYKDNQTIENRKEELVRIIENKDFSHEFQPIYNINSREIIGYSAKLRVKSKLFLNTEDLISFAYEVGMYRQLDRASINNLKINQKICSDFEGNYLFLTHGPYPISKEFISETSLNCSENIKIIFEMWMPVNLEINQMIKIKKEANERGIGISLANIGRKNSNDLLMLSCKPRFARLNREILNKSKKNKDIRESVKRILNYIKTQNTSVIGDFVEDEVDFKLMKKLGIELVQGFYFEK